MKKLFTFKAVILFFLLSSLILSAPPKQTISKIEFVGKFAPGTAVLKKNMKVNEGSIFEKEKPAFITQSIKQTLVNMGYLYARLDSVKIQTDIRDANTVKLLIYGQSGPLVRFGKIIINADSLEEKDYRNLLSISENGPYSGKTLQQNITIFLKYAADNGYPFAKVYLDDIQFIQDGKNHHADVRIAIHEGRKIYIKDILLKGNIYTRDNVILRELNLAKGDLYSGEILKSTASGLSRLGIFKNVKEPEILKAEGDSLYLLIEVEEGNSTRFDGVVGYVPQSTAIKGDGYFTGLLDLTFGNLFGTARRFSVHWKKADINSEEFLMSYTEPWIFGWPLDVGTALERQVRDTTYIEWKNHLDLRLRLTDKFSLLGNLYRTSVTPDSSASRDLRMARNEIFNGEIGIEFDTRDYYLNPRSGLYYKSSYSYGLKRVYGPGYLFSEDSLRKNEDLNSIKVQLDLYYNLWYNQVLAAELHLQQIKGRSLQISDYFWFGGSRSMRGYRENQFRGKIISWANLEYRFILSRNSRLFLFNDWGYYQLPQSSGRKEELLPGYGLGFRFQTPLGILGVDYGLGKGDSFSQGKIHFGLINMF